MFPEQRNYKQIPAEDPCSIALIIFHKQGCAKLLRESGRTKEGSENVITRSRVLCSDYLEEVFYVVPSSLTSVVLNSFRAIK